MTKTAVSRRTARAAVAAVAAVPLLTVLGALGVAVARSSHPRDVEHDPLLDVPNQQPEAIEVRAHDGTALTVRAYGPADGEVIVLAHGWAVGLAYWYPQINAFADRYRVVVYNQRGHGSSVLGAGRPHADLLGADLQAVLKAVVPEGQRALILGHSMGGMTIMSWAGQFPEAVQRYARGVLLASTGATGIVRNLSVIPDKLPFYARPLRYPVSGLIAKTSAPFPRMEVVERVVRYITVDDTASVEVGHFCADMVVDTPFRARGKWGAVFDTLDVSPGLDALKVPTSVIVGDHDRLTPQVHSDLIAQRLAAAGNLAEYLVVPDVGHMSTIEADRDANAMIERLLDQTRDRVTVGNGSALAKSVEYGT